MTAPTHVQSSAHLQTLLSSNTYVILDFYADWCGPCHAVAPLYEQLSKQHSTEGGIIFGKVNVDEQRDIAARYNITAMPTFVFIKDGKVIESIRGANVPAIRNLITKAAADVAKIAEKKKQDGAAAQKPDEPNDVSVSGGYSITKGSSWKMSLN
jgi:thioredoxin 1